MGCVLCCCCSVTQSYPPFATPWTAVRQASLSFTISQSLLKLMSTESVMPSNHLILCHTLLLSSIFPKIGLFVCLFFQWASISHQMARVLELQLQLQHQTYHWIFRYDFLSIDWFDLAVQRALKTISSTTVQKHQFFGAQSFVSLSSSHIHTWPLEKP